MVCIYCGGKTSVTNSRLQKRLNHTWRRRQCANCGTVFTTLESPDLSASIRVRTATGRFEPFSRDRLFVDVVAALGHRKGHVDEASALCAEIIGQIIQNKPGATVAGHDIAEAATTVLGRFDTTAGTYFAAYHLS